MPEDGFIVLEAEGMNINANLDARTEKKGYIALMRQNEKMDQFFDWYDNTVVHRTIQIGKQKLLLLIRIWVTTKRSVTLMNLTKTSSTI